MAQALERFPTDISRGAEGGAKYSTRIVTADSGFEQRNQNWAEARGEWDVAKGVRTKAQMQVLIAFFRAHAGSADNFRFKDWSDFESWSAQTLGTGDGTEQQFQLVKLYSFGAKAVTRKITRPVDASVYTDAAPVRVWFDADEKVEGVDFTVDYTTGLVTATPGVGVVVSATFEFDVPARFDIDHQRIRTRTTDILAWDRIPIVEVRE